jgi:hypothetical protein
LFLFSLEARLAFLDKGVDAFNEIRAAGALRKALGLGLQLIVEG